MEDRVVTRKKRGRPNRGGGRFNRGSSKSSRGRGGRRDGGRDGGRDDKPQYGERRKYESDESYGKKSAPPTPSFEREVRVPMQRLQMTSENQDMVEDMLKDLRGEEFDVYSDEEYDELDDRYEDQYWMTDNTLYVEDAINFSAQKPKVKAPVDTVNRYAVNKLIRYGFEKQRCIEALQLLDGDIGSSFEYLYCKCFDLPLLTDVGNDVDDEDIDEDVETDTIVTLTKAEKLQENGITWEEIEEQRKEEILALEAIYIEEFEIRIPDRLWVFRLELKNLMDMVMNCGKVQKASKETSFGDNSEICKFYKKGACHFGDRCRYKHVIEDAGSKSDSVEKTDKANFELELRFGSDNIYPYEPPIIGFSSIAPGFPSEICLNITESLLKEAQELASAQSPASFSLIALLEDDLMLAQCIEKPPLAFSLPEPENSVIPGVRSLLRKENKSLPKSAKNLDEEPFDNKYNEKQTEALVKMVEAEDRLQQDVDDGNSVTDEMEDKPVTVKRTNSRETEKDKQISQAEIFKQNRRLKDEYQRKLGTKALGSMISQRKRLPAWNKQDDILAALKSHQVLVISGMTGCGKTTQVPQFILDSYLNKKKDLKICNIMCTQPRRISAMAVAERVAEERVDRLGRIVGYQIRLEKVQSSLTRLLFCTTGIVLRRLEGDPDLDGVSHIIIDEVHERSEESDFLMMYLRDMLPNRPDLKIILMSATLNAELFSQYFNGCPIIDIPGKTFPVQSFFLEDAVQFTHFVMEEKSPYARPLKQMNAVRQGQSWQTYEEDYNSDPGKPPGERVKDENLTVKQLMYRYSEYKKSTCKALSMMDLDKINYDLILELLEWIVDGEHQFPQGAVLVFLPGFAEIQQLYEALTSHKVFGARSGGRFKIIPLHSTLSSEDQHAVFLKPPEGVTKIVIATNIAETSITIDDITFVIDAGKLKEKRLFLSAILLYYLCKKINHYFFNVSLIKHMYSKFSKHM